MAQDTNLLKERILAEKPTNQQRDAIFTDDLEFLLRASPGSGKTWTSCRRFVWRAANWNSLGGLALLSFTNAAIQEFETATSKLGESRLLSDPNFAGTFDAFVERFIICPFGHLIAKSTKRPKLLTSPHAGHKKNKDLFAWATMRNGKKVQIPAWEIIPYPEKVGVTLKAFAKFGDAKIQTSSASPLDALLAAGFYTHSQRIYWACNLLKTHRKIANLISRRFPEIIVDEAQDSNVWLLILLKILRKEGSKITLVGDPDQCIYEFSMANVTSLNELREKWRIPEKPLSASFRCNAAIAKAVRNLSGNLLFQGTSLGQNRHRNVFIIKETSMSFTRSIAEFEKKLKEADIKERDSAILCRGYEQLESIRGDGIFLDLKGETKALAQASFHRDCRRNYKRAFEIVEKSLRSITKTSEIWERIDDNPKGNETNFVNLIIWRFIKSQEGLPSIELNGTEWIAKLRLTLKQLIADIGISESINLNTIIKKTGLEDAQMKLPLFQPAGLFSSIRHETIHKVKGESIDAVLVLGSLRFWNSAISSILAGDFSENSRLAYVAMTRARHLLVVGLQSVHYDKYLEAWRSWGFNIV